MAKASSQITVEDTWQQIAASGDTFMFSVLSGEVWLWWSSAEPDAASLGHPFFPGDTFGDEATTENAWVRAKDGSQAICILTTG